MSTFLLFWSFFAGNIYVYLLKVVILVDLVTLMVTDGNNKCSLIQHKTLLEQLLCQKYNSNAEIRTYLVSCESLLSKF